MLHTLGMIFVLVMGVGMVVFCRPIARFTVDTRARVRWEASFGGSERSEFRFFVGLSIFVGLFVSTAAILYLSGESQSLNDRYVHPHLTSGVPTQTGAGQR